MQTLTLQQPDDWHCHFRDGDYLPLTVKSTGSVFARAIAMPNLVPPVINCKQALAYRDRLLKACPDDISFNPLMTLYLSSKTTVDDIHQAAQQDLIVAVKLYPAGATTNSQAGVDDIMQCDPVFEAMQTHKMPLLIHGEVTDPHTDIFMRETQFIDTVLKPLIDRFPTLPIVLEHITTREAVDFILQAPKHIGATITIHHLLLNRNHLLAGGIRPHYYCLPILKTRDDQLALREAALSGNPKFFLGTDSAPHEQHRKESSCGCAGIFSAPVALSLYTQFFEKYNALDKLENFASRFGPRFYGLNENKSTITLQKKPWKVPEYYTAGDDRIIPFYAGKILDWQVVSISNKA